MNIAVIVGRITDDVDVKVTTGGNKVCSFIVAVDDGANNDGSRRTQFLSCTAWNKAAEFLGRYVKKGNRIAVLGRNTKRTYESDGQKHYVQEIVADRVEFADGQNQRNEAQTTAPQNAPQTAQKATQQSFMTGFGTPTEIDESDLPF